MKNYKHFAIYFLFLVPTVGSISAQSPGKTVWSDSFEQNSPTGWTTSGPKTQITNVEKAAGNQALEIASGEKA